MGNFPRRCPLTAAVMGLILVTGSGRADAGMVFAFAFDNGGLGEAPPAMPPLVGSGTVTIANDPGDGTFLLSSLGGFSLSFTFGADQFSAGDIRTPLGQVEVVLTSTSAGRRFQFGNVNAFGTGPERGSIDFINALGASLTFEPPGFGPLNSYQEFGPQNSSQLAGNYTGLAVPEPSTLALSLIGGLVALGGGWFRGREGPTRAIRSSHRPLSPRPRESSP